MFTSRRHSFVSSVICSFLFALAIIAAFSVQILAQNIQYTENNLDQSLRGSANVDPSTLGMSFSVPLANYPGRGMSLPATMVYGSKVWRIKHRTSYTDRNENHTDVKPKFGEYSVAGWTTSLDIPWVEYTGGAQYYDGNGAPLCTDCDASPDNAWFVERIALHMPDGSIHEMRKSDTPVQRYLSEGAPPLTGFYYSTDGARMKYDADQAMLYLPDGSRYWLTAPDGVQYLDRNGNTLSYNASNKQWTDTLGRVIGFVPDNTMSEGQETKTQTLSLPGAGDGTLQYSLVWKKLHLLLGYSSESQMPYDGKENCFNRTFQSPYLFDKFATTEHPCGVRFNPAVLAEIVLPNGRKYVFSYNTYGEITKIELPTGGYTRYSYKEVPGLDYENYSPLYGQANRGVESQSICKTGSCSSAEEYVWSYSAVNEGTKLVITTTNPLGEKSERSLHASAALTYYGFDDARAGRGYDERSYNASNQMLRRSLTEWTSTSGAGTATRDARAVKQVGVILDTGGDALTNTTTLTYDSDLNVTETNSYDYASVDQTTAQTGEISAMPLGSLLRTEESKYLLSDPDFSASWTDYRNLHLIALPTKQFVKNGAGTIVAATKIAYDERDRETYAGSIPGWTDPGTPVRGNPTTTERWQNFDGTSFQTYPSGSFLVTKADYDQCGSVRKTTDANNKQSLVFYDDAFSDGVNRNAYAYATRTESPIPDAGGNYGSNQSLKSYTTYDFQSGKVTKTKDANNKETLYAYHPVNQLNRLQKVTQPDGGETTYSYDDTPGSLNVRTRVKQNTAGTSLDDYTYLDGLGRPRRTGHYEGPNSWSVKDTEYDSLGRVSKISNPYFASNLSGGVNPSGVWTTTTYDALGRVLTVTTPDGSAVTTAYSGNEVTVSDALTRQRRSRSDALGRLSEVIEDPAGASYSTTYGYDPLGNLLTVTQGEQQRFFLYDSLSRLIRAKNPEQDANPSIELSTPWVANSQWSLKYVYDPNGNMTSKTDARNVTTGYSYDAINRNTYVSYNDGTPDIERHYDAAENGKGRLHYNLSKNVHPVTGASAHSSTVINSYDAAGRPLNQTQKLQNSSGAWISYNLSRSYDLAGHVTSQTSPSGRRVDYSYNAGGRTSSFSGQLGDGVQRTYADTFSYNAAGQMTKEHFGTTASLYHTAGYNSRLQMVEARLGTSTDWASTASWNRGRLRFYLSDAARGAEDPWMESTSNNGNVSAQDHQVPLTVDAGNGTVTSSAITMRDDYYYDSLNRLKQAQGYQLPSGGSWNNIYQQTFSYDQYGNRKIKNDETWGNAINNADYTINTANNRVNGSEYDATGNVKSDPNGPNQMTYDAENRMKSALKNGQWNYYVYDTEGKRVRRVVSSTEYWQVYGLGGELIAEYPVDSAASTPQTEYGYREGQMLVVGGCDVIRWLVADHLGTPRMEVGPSGSLSSMRRHDYLPFGEELLVGMGNDSIRSTDQGYTADCVRQRFGSKERDTETGLDYFLARYYSNIQGRFTSVDPENAGAIPDDPQSWNGYAYARSNPVVYSDPDGRKYKICSPDGKECYEHTDKDFDNFKAASGKEGYIVKGGEIYNKDGSLVGTYQRTYFDNESEQFNRFVFGMADRAPAIKGLIGIAAGAGVVGGVTGGVGLYAFGGSAGITTLGTLGRVAAPVTTGGAAFLNQLGRTDAQVFQRAINQGLSAANTFADNIGKLAQAVREVIPAGQVNKIGEIGGSPVWGSLRSGVGIARVDGVQVVVKVVQGTPKIIGKLP